MRNNENGITIIKFVFMVIILLVVIAGIVFIVKRLWQSTSTNNIETNLLYIQAKCKIIYDKNKIDANEQLLGENITEYVEDEKVNEIISGSDKWYRLTQENLESMGLTELKAEDGYIVNYEENEVIYAKGTSIQGDEAVYYKLSDLQNAEEQKLLEEQQKEKEKQEKEQEKEQQSEETVHPQIEELDEPIPEGMVQSEGTISQ